MTTVTIPKLRFNTVFKTKKEARQEAIKALMSCINDEQILNAIKVSVKRKPYKDALKNKSKKCPAKGSK